MPVTKKAMRSGYIATAVVGGGDQLKSNLEVQKGRLCFRKAISALGSKQTFAALGADDCYADRADIERRANCIGHDACIQHHRKVNDIGAGLEVLDWRSSFHRVNAAKAPARLNSSSSGKTPPYIIYKLIHSFY